MEVFIIDRNGKAINRNMNKKSNYCNYKEQQNEIGTNYNTQGTRLNKYLAEAGICSRRDADRLIDIGAVMLNGRVAKAGERVFDGDEVLCHGKVVGGKKDTAVLAYYKPVGVVCSERDKHADKLLTDQLHFPVRVTYAGRLDKDSEGLLLMTNDGNLIDKLMRGANRHEKEYIVKVKTEITDEFIENMANGVYLPELDKTTRPCVVEKIGKLTFRIILTQGLNRQIRRMCAEFGYEVHSLKRVRVANIELGKLHAGEYRIVVGEELQKLYAIAGL